MGGVWVRLLAIGLSSLPKEVYLPRAPKRGCPGVGPRRGRCPGLVGRNERCCSDCLPHLKKEVRAYDAKRDESAERQFLHSTAWRSLRAWKLRSDPLCSRHLQEGRAIKATLVHHKDENQFNNREENLESLCHECHEVLHRKGRRYA
jgi:hypothetical protein